MRSALAALSSPTCRLKKPPASSPKIVTKEGAAVNFSDQEFTAMVEAAADFSDYRSGRYFAKATSGSGSGAGSALRLCDPAILPAWAIDLRQMLRELAAVELNSKHASTLVTLSEIGARYGLHTLQKEIPPGLLGLISQKAKMGLKRDLQRILQRVTRRCLELERTSYGLALAALGLQGESPDSKSVERKFLGEQPSERLFSLFGKFPVLARLWFQLISQWRDQTTELLKRLVADRTALAHAFFGGQPFGPITDLAGGLSDPHNKGRTVMLLQFAAGSVIYKPRLGDGEWEWGSLLHRMNAQSFKPRLKAARVLRRQGYYWMERIESAPCEEGAATERYYKRLGGLIAAAYLLKAVDCHRDNLITSGEDPVLIDADALWHPSPDGKVETAFDLLDRTGFFPNSNRRSLQSRSSVLGHATKGKASGALRYEREIVNGFRRAWRCVLGTRDRRAAFARRLRRICSSNRRSIYWPTEKYAAIARASIQPAALRSGIERDLLIARLCSRKAVSSAVLQAEIDALKRLDIPYFTRRLKARPPPDYVAVPANVIEELRRALSN
jgi:lantibiotic modifying enzyme